MKSGNYSFIIFCLICLTHLGIAQNVDQQVVCNTDELKYPQSKATGFQQISLNNATSATAVGQYFDAPGPLTLYGFHFYAFVNNSGDLPVSVLAEVYGLTPDSLPTGQPLASVMVTVSNTDETAPLADLKHTATFANPVLINQPYMITIANHSAVNMAAIFNDYAAGDGQQEWLQSALLFNTWTRSYDIIVGGNAFDADLICEPIVSYAVSVGFTPSATTGSVVLPVDFNNTSSGFFDNRMYNTNFSMPWQWQFGDGSSSSEKQPSYAFSPPGMYLATLTATLSNWAGSTCSETPMANIEVTGPECVTDIIQYPQSKSTSTEPISINNASSAEAIAQYFDAPGSLTLYGFHFYASAPNNMPVQVDAEVYLVGADSIPTGDLLASTSLIVDNFDKDAPMADLKHTAVFANPVLINQPYTIVIRNRSSSTLSVLFNDYAAGDGQQEWLLSALLFNTWVRGYDVNVGGETFDADLICAPIVSYDLSAGFMPDAVSATPGQPLSFTNTSSDFFGNRMYNANLNNAWFWNFDDGNTNMTGDGMNTYANAGQYNPTLTATLSKWTGGTCIEMATADVCIEGSMPICELLNTTEGMDCSGNVDATYDVDNDAFELTSNGCYDPAFYSASDADGFASSQFCGDGEINAQVIHVTGSGFAVDSMRESTTPGSKKLQVMIDGSLLTRRELRQSTGALAYAHLFQTLGKNWLRITRSGNQFSAYHSFDGTNWGIVVTAVIPMTTCIEVGLVNRNNTTDGSVTGTFENISIISGSAPLVAPNEVDITSAFDQAGFSVFPNPATDEVNLQINQFIGKAVEIQFYNLYGQTILYRQLEEVAFSTEKFATNLLPPGTYMVEIRSEGQSVMEKLVVSR